jgi:hypothetical protein
VSEVRRKELAVNKPFTRLLIAIAFFWAAGEVRSQSLSQAERDLLISHLEKSRANLEQATTGLSPAQWTFKPGVFRWSVAECVEHIALAEDFLFSILNERVMKAPAPTAPKDPIEAGKADQGILNLGIDRSSRFQAPEPTRPKHQAATPQELLKRFYASRSRTLDFARSTQDLRAHCAETPLGKCTDGYQWLLLMTAHSERHTRQLLEVKADPKFPKQ